MKRKDEAKARAMGNSLRNGAIKKIGMKVGFTLSAPEAREVFLTGEFNHWDVRSLPMKRGKDGS